MAGTSIVSMNQTLDDGLFARFVVPLSIVKWPLAELWQVLLRRYVDEIRRSVCVRVCSTRDRVYL